MLRYLFNLGLVFSRWSRLYMWIRRVVRRKSILGNILFSLYPTYQKYKSFIITYRLHLFVLSIVETVNKYISNPDVIKRSKTYWILHRSLVIVCHYGRVKTIWGRIFAWSAIFRGKIKMGIEIHTFMFHIMMVIENNPLELILWILPTKCL